MARSNQTETPRTPFERINIDILKVPSRNHALTIRDELTKFSQAYAISDKSAKTVANILLFSNISARPSASIKTMAENLIIHFSTLLDMIRAHKAENPDELSFNILPYAVIVYNNSQNKTTGFTPFNLLFGHTSSRPPETLYILKELISKYVKDLNNRISHYHSLTRERTNN